MDIDLQSVDINQCASGPGWYSNTHLCDLNSTQARRMGPLGPPFIPFSHHCLPPSSQEHLTKPLWYLRASRGSQVIGRGEMAGFCKGRPTYSLPHTFHLSPRRYSSRLLNLNVPLCLPSVWYSALWGSSLRQLLSLTCFPSPRPHAPQ